MNARNAVVLLCACLINSWAVAQSADAYQVPRTEYGQPDLQGVWGFRSSTMLERPEGLPPSMPLEQANGFAEAVAGSLGDNNDPDIDRFGPHTLNVVNGEHRTSMIVSPADGILPYNELGIQNSSHGYFTGVGYDGPEQRPGVERCTEAWGNPPMNGFLYQLYHGIVQTKDKIAIIGEEVAAVRVIHMDGYQRPEAVTSFDGHSVGHWEGDTLVVEITHFSDVNHERASMGRPMLISGNARVTERFTRVSETTLNYQYTVDDPTYYTEPWVAELSFTRDPSGHIYEFACHEGNYSMIGALRGARVQKPTRLEKPIIKN